MKGFQAPKEHTTFKPLDQLLMALFAFIITGALGFVSYTSWENSLTLATIKEKIVKLESAPAQTDKKIERNERLINLMNDRIRVVEDRVLVQENKR